METPENQSKETDQAYDYKCGQRNKREGKVAAGLLIITIGTLLLARKMGVMIPHWVFSWKMLLIAIGLFIGFRHNFRGVGWMIPIFIGSFFLLNDYMPFYPVLHYLLPLLIIAAGFHLIFRPSRPHGHKAWKKGENLHENSPASEDYLDSVSIFGGIKKNIISKDFKGGDVTCVFGGAEINLSQADIQGRVVLNATQIFGGALLVVPPNWEIRSEMTAILGGIEDKRSMAQQPDPEKILVLKGTTLFGGLEIKSF